MVFYVNDVLGCEEIKNGVDETIFWGWSHFREMWHEALCWGLLGRRSHLVPGLMEAETSGGNQTLRGGGRKNPLDFLEKRHEKSRACQRGLLINRCNSI